MQGKIFFIVGALVFLTVFQCSKPDRSGGMQTNGSAESSLSKAAGNDDGPFAGFQPDRELCRRLDAIAARCEIQPVGAQVNCPPADRGLPDAAVLAAQKLAHLDTFSWYILNRNEREQAAAVNVLRRILSNLTPQESAQRLDRIHWERFRAAFSKLANPRLAFAMDSTLSAAASMAGANGELNDLLQRDPVLRARVIPHWMHFARMSAFEYIDAWARQAIRNGDAALLRACLDAPARMPEWSSDETSVLCPWVREILAAGRLHAWPPVARLYRNCPRDPYVQELAELLRDAPPEIIRGADLAALGDLQKKHCPPPGHESSATACEKLREVIGRIAAHPGTAPDVRRAAQSILDSDAH